MGSQMDSDEYPEPESEPEAEAEPPKLKVLMRVQKEHGYEYPGRASAPWRQQRPLRQIIIIDSRRRRRTARDARGATPQKGGFTRHR